MTNITVTTPAVVSDGTNILRHRPSANTVTEYEAMLIVQTTVATNNPISGWAWATSLTDGAAQIFQTSSGSTTLQYQSGNTGAALAIPAGGVPTASVSWPVTFRAVTVAGATSPGGFNQVQIAAEIAGGGGTGIITVKAGSFLRYRTL
jgi:hypothetical protein